MIDVPEGPARALWLAKLWALIREANMKSFLVVLLLLLVSLVVTQSCKTTTGPRPVNGERMHGGCAVGTCK